jgi:hypothetical protein
VRLVTRDAHEGLKVAIAAVLHGASWQRCRVHFVRNALALVPTSAAELVAASIREQWRRVADGFRGRFPRLAAFPDTAEDDVLAYLSVPLATSLVDEPAGATDQGGEAADRRGGNLPRSGRGRPAGGSGTGRAACRVAG